MRGSRVVSSLAVAAGLVATTLTAAQPASAVTTAAAASGARCSAYSFVGKHGIYTYKKKATVTHALQVGVAPGGTHSETRTADYQRTVSASSSKSAEVGGSVNWIWGSVNAHFKITVHKTKSHTVAKSVKVTDTVHNSSSKNQAFVAYRGVTQYYGQVYVTYCAHPGSTGIGDVARHYYAYSNWAGGGEGIVWCKGGKPSALIAAAINGYCR